MTLYRVLQEQNKISWCPLLCTIESREKLRGYTRWFECSEVESEQNLKSKVIFALAGKAAEAVYSGVENFRLKFYQKNVF